MEKQRILGIELGSTRIKAVVIDENHRPVSSGGYAWKSRFENGIWTYDLADAWKGLREALSQLSDLDSVSAVGISGMMHGYLAFDKDWNQLVPFRTWQNTVTAQAAEALTEALEFNIPQRWTSAHLYQAILNKEPHVPQVAHVTSLAGYIHYMLTGVNCVGLDEASGMFPLNGAGTDYDEEKIAVFDRLIREQPFTFRQVFPKAVAAGENAGCLTGTGAKLLGGILPAGIPFAPPEGDAGTGMVATNAVAKRTGNVSAGTSIFSMVVMERPLKKVYPEIDIIATPAGLPVAMVHGNNCTNDMNAWVSVLGETAKLFGGDVDDGTLFTQLYRKSLEGDPDCGGLLVYNYMAGEGVTHMDEGRPMVIRRPDSKFTLANFLRAQLYSTMVILRIGMDLIQDEKIAIDSLTGHGGLFKTPGVGQRYMAAACRAPITCMETAGEGGPYGMALLAAYMKNREAGESLEAYLGKRVFADARSVTLAPTQADMDGFEAYRARYVAGLPAEQAATQLL